jgi:hypothetical protein
MIMEPMDGKFHLIGSYFAGWGGEGNLHNGEI